MTTLPVSSSQILANMQLTSNLSCAELLNKAVADGEGRLSADGAFCAETGAFTGRSPKDRFIVCDAITQQTIDWGPINQALSPDSFASLKQRIMQHTQGKHLYAQDLFVGADPSSQLGIRVVCEQAWHAAFARTLLRRPNTGELAAFSPDWTLIQCPSLESIPEEDSTNSSTFVVMNFSERLILIGGTAYAGEIKKSAFAMLNYLLPAKGIFPMHCSANAGTGGDVTLFFGLSGTGKTTLSADRGRHLIGDDEHGWGQEGVFNFEGGCYAKAIDLTPEREPEIFAASAQPGAILENVILDPDGKPDFADTRLTENTRCAYPLNHIDEIVEGAMGGHPNHVVFLTLDAFGVLPPLSKLTPDQATQHFLMGYTSKVAGTERGLGKEPEATFSTCYGAPFMPRSPQTYAALLKAKLAQHGTQVWLVNTGWVGGGYGVGERISLTHTRALIRAIMAGHLENVEFEVDPIFGLAVPRSCPQVPADILNPEKNWEDSDAYRSAAAALKGQFDERLQAFSLGGDGAAFSLAPAA